MELRLKTVMRNRKVNSSRKERFPYSQVHNLMRKLKPPVIITGDFSAYNTLWGGPHTNNRGRVLERIIDDHDIFC